MYNIYVLAQQTSRVVHPTAAESTVMPVRQLWDHIMTIGLPEAAMFIAFGIICLFYGWRIFKALAIMCSSLVGLVVGLFLSHQVGGESNPLLGIIMAIVFGVIAVPMMRWAVSILGALSGAIITAGIWYALELPEEYMWAGGLTGLVAGGMISFIVFKIAVMLFTALGGSSMIVAGILSLLYQYNATSARIQQEFFGPRWFLPVLVILPTFFGLYWQNRFMKKSPEWTV